MLLLIFVWFLFLFFIQSISPGIVRTEIGDAANAAMEDNERIDRKLLTGALNAVRPELESEDIAEAVVYVLGTPARVQIHELTIKPVGEAVWVMSVAHPPRTFPTAYLGTTTKY